MSKRIIVVGAGGVGKTTIASALAMHSAATGTSTLVMTFDPSQRLRDTLGLSAEERSEAGARPVEIAGGADLRAVLLDPRRTFDALIVRHCPDEASARRILENRFYEDLGGHLSGILEYMAVEELFRADNDRKAERLVLDTPPTSQALDFLEAPERIVGFLDSGAVNLATRSWFDDDGRLRTGRKLGIFGRGIEAWLDRMVGLDLLRAMAEFFQAFAPLYAGFRRRAMAVSEVLRSPDTLFVLVSGPASDRIADTMFFARKLKEKGFHLGPIIVNRIHHPASSCGNPAADGTVRAGMDTPLARTALWLAQRDGEAVDHFRTLLPEEHPVIPLPIESCEPTSQVALLAIGRTLAASMRRFLE